MADSNLEYGKAQDWIAVDLDGTLAQYESGQYALYGSQYIAAPVPAMLARVKQWLSEGRDVRIFTARVDGGACLPPDSPALEDFKDVDKVRRSIEDWCLYHIGQKLPVTNVKDYGTTEIWDDRAVSVERNTGRRLDGRPEHPGLLARPFTWYAGLVAQALLWAELGAYAFYQAHVPNEPLANFWQVQTFIMLILALGSICVAVAVLPDAAPWKRFQ